MHLLTAGLELYVGSRFGRESRFYLQLLKKKKYIHTSSFESPFITDSSLGSKNAKLHT